MIKIFTKRLRLDLLLQMVTANVVSVLTNSITVAFEMLSAISGLIRFHSSFCCS